MTALSIQNTRITVLEEQMKPQNWQEFLVSPIVNPKLSGCTRLVYKVALTIFTGTLTIATLGLGYFLMRSLYTSYCSYQERVDYLIADIAQEKLYPGYSYSENKVKKRQFDPAGFQRGAACEDVQRRIENGLEDINVPDEVIAGWRAKLQHVDEKSQRDTYQDLVDDLIKSIKPLQMQRENNRFVDVLDVFWDCKIDDYRMDNRIRNKRAGADTLEKYLSDLKLLYRLRSLAREAYGALPECIDLSEVYTYFNINDDIVCPTIYGMALLAAYYQMKYGITIHVGRREDLKDLLQDPATPSRFGFILFKDNLVIKGAHVTPIVVLKDQHTILQLDSVGDNFANGLSRKDAPQFHLANLNVSRQADHKSCRNDAMNILCNALLDIKEHGVKVPKKSLPPAWAKTVQKSAALMGVNTQDPVRSKRHKSLEDFIKAHTDETEKRRYLLRKGHKYGAKLIELVENQEKYPQIWDCFRKKLPKLESMGFSVKKPLFSS